MSIVTLPKHIREERANHIEKWINDNYDGGEIYFPNQGVSYKPRKFSAVFFPSAGTEYIHGISRVTSGHRFTALYMHTSLPQHVDPEYHPGINSWKAMDHPYVRS